MYNLSYCYDNVHDLNKTLQEIGLSVNEASVFAVLVHNSPSSATLLAKKLHFSRSSVYTVLSALTAKGLVSTTYKNEVKQFVAQDYTSLEQYLKTQQSELSARFQVLEKAKNQIVLTSSESKNVPSVSFFEGQEGLKKVYMTMMRNCSKNDTLHLIRDEFVWQDEWKFIFENEWSSRVSRIKKEKAIKTKLLVNHSVRESKAQDVYRQKQGLLYRFLPSECSVSNFAQYTLGEMSATMSMEAGNLVGILVSNINIADNQRQIFNGLWKISQQKF